jgi:preprotein translocase subunit SecG
MFRGDQVRYSTSSLAAIAACALVFLILSIGYGLYWQGQYQRESDYRKNAYAVAKYDPAYEACLRLAYPDKTDCISKAYQESRENERDERDLVAQETTAIWTFVMSVAALVGVVLSIFGVGLVWVTFRETRETNVISRKIGVTQLDLPPGHPSFITRVLGVDSGRLRLGQAGRARSHQVAQSPGALLLGSDCPARNAA